MMETPPLRKFMFDRSFEGALSANPMAPPERKPVTLTPEQYDALKQESYEEGFASGRQARGDEQTQQLNQTLIAVEQRMTALMATVQTQVQDQQAKMHQAILAIARKILPDFTARQGLQEIQALLTDTITEMAHEPRLVVRLHESQVDTVNERINEITAQKAYAGKVIVLADPALAVGDCRIEWADGGIERNAEATWKAVEKLIEPDNQQT